MAKDAVVGAQRSASVQETVMFSENVWLCVADDSVNKFAERDNEMVFTY